MRPNSNYHLITKLTHIVLSLSIVLSSYSVLEAIDAFDADLSFTQENTAYSAQLDSCESYLNAKDYDKVILFAQSVYNDVEGFELMDFKLDAIYYLVRSHYYKREYDSAIKLGEEGIALALELSNDERLAFLYNIMGIVGRRTDNCEDAIDHYLLALEVNNRINDSLNVSRNYLNLSVCYQKISDYHSSFQALNKAEEIRTKLKDTLGIAIIYFSFGNGYEEIHDYEAAYEYYMKAKEIYESIGDEEMVYSCTFNIGLVFHELKDFDKALESYQHVLAHALEIDDDDEFIGTIYQNIANLYGSIDSMDRSISFHQKAAMIFDTLDSKDQLADVQMNMAVQYLHNERLDSAEILLYKAYDYIKDNSSIDSYINTLIELGHFHTLKGNYNLAEDFLKQSVDLSESTNYLELSSYANKYLFELYQKKGNLNKAIEHLMQYQMFKDSIDRSEQERNIDNYKLKNDLERQQSEIVQLNYENELKTLEVEKAADQKKLFLSLMALMVIIIGGVSYLFQFARRKNKIISLEKERSDELLLNILPDETAEELKNYGKVKAKEYAITTVMFTDFVDFTHYSGRMKSEDIVRSVDHYFSAFDSIVEKHGIEKIKTIGDAYMCVGGIPIVDNDNADNVIKAAKEILAFVEDNINNPQDGIVPFKIRIGINSGPVVAGVVGLHKFQYDVWGDTVNIAARMESACEPGKINISQTTYELIKDDYNCSYRGEKEMKNRGVMKMYYID